MSERHSMRKIREVLGSTRTGWSHREISAAVGLSKGAVHEYLERANAAQLGWEEALARRRGGGAAAVPAPRPERATGARADRLSVGASGAAPARA